MSEWNNIVKRILKSELIKRGLSTEDLMYLLNKNGGTETKSSIDSKISRGTFSASFFMHCLSVIGCTKFEIEDYRLTLINTENSILQNVETIKTSKENEN